MKPPPAAWLPLMIGLVLAGLYSTLNLAGEMFVHRLGCGCHRGFNTNSLTLLVGLVIAVIVFTGCITSSKAIRPSLRSGYLLSAIGSATILLAAFVILNAWA